MIDIKIIGRKKNAGTAQAAVPGTGIVRGSGLTTSDKATEAAYADEAKHAAMADEATGPMVCAAVDGAEAARLLNGSRLDPEGFAGICRTLAGDRAGELMDWLL